MRNVNRLFNPKKAILAHIDKLEGVIRDGESYDPNKITHPESQTSIIDDLKRRNVAPEKLERFFEEIKIPLVLFKNRRKKGSDIMISMKNDFLNALRWLSILRDGDLIGLALPNDVDWNRIEDSAKIAYLALSEITIEFYDFLHSRKRGQKSKADDSGFVFDVASAFQKHIGKPSLARDGAFYKIIQACLFYSNANYKAPDRAIKAALEKLRKSQ